MTGFRRLTVAGTALLATTVALPAIAVLGATSTPTGAGNGISAAAVGDIPPAMLTLYLEGATRCPGLSWAVLAAIGKIETDHGRLDAPGVTSGTNFAGAAGPMQFIAGTWATYGTDGDGDERIDIYDPADAVAAAADYLCASGAGDPARLPDAIYAYNHAQWYVDEILATAADYAAIVPMTSVPVSDGQGSTAGRVAVAFAAAQLGTPYRWGGQDADGFDCSGLTQAAYTAAGITLPRTAQTQRDHGPLLPAGTPLAPGDLVFYGDAPTHVTHMGIYIGSGQMIDAPHTGAVVRVENYARRNYLGATRPAA